MDRIHTVASLAADFVQLGLQRDAAVMVHSSLGRVGWTDGGPAAVIEALLEVIGPDGTLVIAVRRSKSYTNWMPGRC
ncbi:MAG TPA: AAC(3) family N-acetyltransferase [Steroidobacteraceae bacterium]|nr:AAC(3) family N-acetyltransferase [Steroidobacteraceae bacterium]